MKPAPSKYFVIKDAKRVDGRMIFSGDMVFEPTPEHSEKQAAHPPITIRKPFELKWVLPTRHASFYGASKAFAESMGYETVENDDMTYPR